VTRVNKIGSEVRGHSPPKNGGANIKIIGKFRTTSQLIANISGTKQDIVEQKTSLHTAVSSAHAFFQLWSINGENETGVSTDPTMGVGDVPLPPVHVPPPLKFGEKNFFPANYYVKFGFFGAKIM